MSKQEPAQGTWTIEIDTGERFETLSIPYAGQVASIIETCLKQRYRFFNVTFRPFDDWNEFCNNRKRSEWDD